jgi:hypothetical protein
VALLLRTVILVGILTASYFASAAAQGLQELRVGWNAYVGSPAPQVAPGAWPQSPNVFTVLQSRQRPGSLPRHRNPELAVDQLLVIAFNAQGAEVDAQVIADPRVLRAEGPEPTGSLSGEVLHHATTEFLITLPNDPGITELRVYQPRWTGSGFVLDWLGSIHLP